MSDRIDYQALQELKEMLEDEFSDLVETYIRDTCSKRSALEELNPDQQSDDIRKLAHSLKGASINLGLMHVGDVAMQLEEQAKDQSVSDYQQHLDDITKATDHAIEELKQLLD